MGRPTKQKADYFPHFVTGSRTKFILEDTWGNDGYAFWFKLLELLCKSDGHNYDCSNKTDMKYLVALTKVDEATAVDECLPRTRPHSRASTRELPGSHRHGELADLGS